MYQYRGKLKRVVDGDTFDIELDLGFYIKHQIRVRLKDVDTPEIWSPENNYELEHARAAKAFVEGLVAEDNYVEVQTYKDRATSFGRFVADVCVRTPSGEMADLKDLIVERGMVKLESYDRPYTAEGAK